MRYLIPACLAATAVTAAVLAQTPPLTSTSSSSSSSGAASSSGVGGVPAPAAAVGYTTLTFGPAVTIGGNWVPFRFYGQGAPRAGYASQNADGSVYISGSGTTSTQALATAAPASNVTKWSGAAFGPGYYEAVISYQNPDSEVEYEKPFAALLVAGAMSFAFGGAVLADADPTVHQIYEAAESGHLDQAQQMIEQVLRDHPNSAKAHYVQSELFAREGKLGQARAELDRAEQLEPGLPKENPRSVAELKEQLGRRGGGLTGGGRLGGGGLKVVSASRAVVPADRSEHGVGDAFPMGHGADPRIVGRCTLDAVPPTHAKCAVSPERRADTCARRVRSWRYPGAYGGIVGGGGLGSTLAGGLAGGLAAGAGIVAGEELAHHFLDGEHPSAPAHP
jgi:hypothetical protein